MKISCSKDELLAGVNAVQRAVSAKNTLPILQGIYLKAENSILQFEATDLEIGIRYQIAVNILEEGIVVLPARLFSEIVRKLPDTEITLESNEKIVKLNYLESDLTLNGYDPEEFPEISDIADSEEINIPSSTFRSMIRQTIFACATEETRPVFTGILMQIEGESIQLVSTDTHRLAFSKSIIPRNQNGFMGIIPSKTMQEIYRLLGDEQVLTIKYNKTRVIFSFASIEIMTRLIEGQFPSYKQVIPKTCNTKLFLNTKKFMDSVERASLLARDNYLKTNTVRFSIEESKLTINQHSEIGKINEQMDIQQDGEGLSISFNAKYILDVLKVIETENILMEASGSFSPCIVRPENDEENYLCLILPLRS